MTFEQLDLDDKLLRAIRDAGFTACTPVQEQTFTYSLIGADVAVQSQTGTGKTAAFLITIFQLFLEQRSLDDRIALIVAPTRELADQIEMDARQLAKYLDLPIASFYGGVGYEKQERALAEGVRVAIGTPGRLLDFAKQRKLDLRKVGILVIDEADRLFDMGFIPDLRRLIRQMPGRDERITMLYSATLSTRVKSLAWEYMKNPAEITITPERVTVDEISQELYHVPRERKLSLLLGLLERDRPRNALIFTNTKQAAFEVATRLQRNDLACEYIIGDLPQSKRQRLIDDLKAGELQYLVATDVAARGLHVEELDLVVNYDLPEYSENYVHRVGRTARAGRSGKAIALACEEYVLGLEGIEEFIRMRIPAVTANADLYAEDASAGKRVGHYLDQRRRDDRRGSRSAGRSAAGGGRRVTVAAPAAAGAGRDGGLEAAARERPAAPHAASGGEPDSVSSAAATAPAGSRRGRGRRRVAARDTSAAAGGDGRSAVRAGSSGGNGAAPAPASPAPAASGAAANGAAVGQAGGDGQSGRRQGNATGGGERRPRTTEERLAYYREKYGEDFRLADSPAGAAVPATGGGAAARGTQNGSLKDGRAGSGSAPNGRPEGGGLRSGDPQNGSQQSGGPQSGVLHVGDPQDGGAQPDDAQEPSGLRGLLPRLFRRHVRSRST